MTNTYNPNSVSPPGETFAELMDGMMSLDWFASEYHFSPAYLTRVIRGEARMVSRLIGAICAEFGTDVIFWHNREERYWEWKNANIS